MSNLESISMVTAVSSVITVGGRLTQTTAGVYGYPGSRQETVSREVAQSGSASGLGPEGRGFKSLLLYHLKTDHQTRSRTGTASSAVKQMLRGFHCSVPQLF